jgi:hypothetical protein
MNRLWLAGVVLAMAGCSGPADSGGGLAIVGARLEPSLDAEPIPFSVVVVREGKIAAAGPQASTPVPKGAETMQGAGKVIQPSPYTATIAVGEPANLLLRDAESGTPERIMQDGNWIQ